MDLIVARESFICSLSHLIAEATKLCLNVKLLVTLKFPKIVCK